jgi:hypothetical protein
MCVENGELAQDFALEEGARLLELRHVLFLFCEEKVNVWSELVTLLVECGEGTVTLLMCSAVSTMISCLLVPPFLN